jgi:hypothetical protein
MIDSSDLWKFYVMDDSLQMFTRNEVIRIIHLTYIAFQALESA